MNEYIENVIKTVERRDNAKPEYIQCVKEVFRSLEKVIEEHPEYVEDDLLTRMAEPDRLITFRVAWVDDNGKTQVNRGYRVQFNSSIGPYKGGLRFHPSVNSSIMYYSALSRPSKTRLQVFQWAVQRAVLILTREERARAKLCVSARHL